MNGSLLTLVLACAATLLAIARPDADQCNGAEPPADHQALGLPAEAVIVLQDGGVLTGQVSRSDDRYVVVRDAGELSVPAAKVTIVCRTLDEAYEQKRRQIAQPTVEAHLNLAEWCFRYQLLPQAARELVDARGIDPRHPRLALLERRLAVAGGPPRCDRTQAAVASDNATPPRTAAKASFPRSAANDVIGTNELSAAAVEQFTRKIQPILVNNCSTTGCHQLSGSQQFQLDRAVLHGMSNRRSTFQNLEATLALIDREAPQNSRLLTVPRHAHGGMDHAVFGPRQSQLIARLAEWVAVVTNTTTGDEPAAVAATEESPHDASDLAPPTRRGTFVTKPADNAPSKDSATGSGVVQASHESETSSLAAPPKLRHGAQVRKQPWRPKDPFDAEIFNQQSTSANSSPHE